MQIIFQKLLVKVSANLGSGAEGNGKYRNEGEANTQHQNKQTPNSKALIFASREEKGNPGSREELLLP